MFDSALAVLREVVRLHGGATVLMLGAVALRVGLAGLYRSAMKGNRAQIPWTPEY